MFVLYSLKFPFAINYFTRMWAALKPDEGYKVGCICQTGKNSAPVSVITKDTHLF